MQATDARPQERPELMWSSQAVLDIAAERRRHVEHEGFDPLHDDSEHAGSAAIAKAAGCYILFADAYPNRGEPPPLWPWDAQWWKPKDYRRDLVRAGALIVAEIERLDRAAG